MKRLAGSGVVWAMPMLAGKKAEGILNSAMVERFKAPD
jgi:hypothetical protein